MWIETDKNWSCYVFIFRKSISMVNNDRIFFYVRIKSNCLLVFFSLMFDVNLYGNFWLSFRLHTVWLKRRRKKNGNKSAGNFSLSHSPHSTEYLHCQSRLFFTSNKFCFSYAISQLKVYLLLLLILGLKHWHCCLHHFVIFFFLFMFLFRWKCVLSMNPVEI